MPTLCCVALLLPLPAPRTAAVVSRPRQLVSGVFVRTHDSSIWRLLPLMAGMSSADVLCRRFVATGVSNIAAHGANQQEVLGEGAPSPPLQLARMTNGDIECRRCATIGLTNSAATKANHVTSVGAALEQLMRGLIDHPDIGVSDTA